MRNIIKIFLLVLTLAVVMPVTPSYAKKSAKKEQRTLKKELKKRADRDSRREARQLVKEGWKTMPGNLPIEKQLQQAKYAQLMLDEDGGARYVVATHRAIGGNYTAAKEIADSRAHLELAKNVKNTITQHSESRVGQMDLGDGDIDLMDDYMSVSQGVVSAQLRGTHPIVEIYRPQANGSYEIMVVFKMDADAATKAAKKELRESMQEKAEKMKEEM